MNNNIKAEKQNTYDAIVVGSGISGGLAAKELTEKGLRVLMLERGRNVEHVKDYDTALMKPWEFKHRGRVTLEDRKMQPVQTRGGMYSEFNAKFWVNDMECPYTEVKRFDWYRGYGRILYRDGRLHSARDADAAAVGGPSGGNQPRADCADDCAGDGRMPCGCCLCQFDCQRRAMYFWDLAICIR